MLRDTGGAWLRGRGRQCVQSAACLEAPHALMHCTPLHALLPCSWRPRKPRCWRGRSTFLGLRPRWAGMGDRQLYGHALQCRFDCPKPAPLGMLSHCPDSPARCPAHCPHSHHAAWLVLVLGPQNLASQQAQRLSVAYNNLAGILKMTSRLAECIQCYEHVVFLQVGAPPGRGMASASMDMNETSHPRRRACLRCPRACESFRPVLPRHVFPVFLSRMRALLRWPCPPPACSPTRPRPMPTWPLRSRTAGGTTRRWWPTARPCTSGQTSQRWAEGLGTVLNTLR